MTKTFLISAVVVFGSIWLLFTYFLRRPDFLSKPEEVQLKAKKQLYRGFYAGIALSTAYFLLIITKTAGWIPWLAFAAYFLFWIGGGYMLWSAYQVGIRKDTSKMKKSNGELFTNPQRFMSSIAITNLLCGLALWLIALAIPVFKIGLAHWAPLIVVIGGARQLLTLVYEKADGA